MAAERGPPAQEVLAALVASLRQDLAAALGALEETRGELAQARERIAELEARLRQTPRNSSGPPSSEGLDKPPPRPRSLRKKTGRKPGGQDVHEGSTLAQVARPDQEARHEPGCCGRCGAGLHHDRRASSALFAATYPPPPNTASASSTPWSCSPKASPGYPPSPDQTTTISAT